MLVTMVHPWRGERQVHRKAAPKYERNGWRYKPEPEPDPPRRRRPKPKTEAEPTEPSETDSEGFSMPEHEEGSS